MNRPRGLCWTCFYTPVVRALYQPTSKYGRRGVGNHTGVRPLPAEPTDALPRSKEKMRVMRQRARRGESLFHPLDNPGPPVQADSVFTFEGREGTIDDGWLGEVA